MYLELSALILLERHLERERSDGFAGIPLGDRPGRGGYSGADLGRTDDLQPAPCSEQVARGLVRPVQTQPKA